jgi:hypothetical protein
MMTRREIAITCAILTVGALVVALFVLAQRYIP